MPCDSIRTNSVDLKALGRIDPKLLAAALNALGIQCEVMNGFTNGVLVAAISGSNVNWQPGQELNLYRSASRVTLDQVKQAYSGEVVKATAKRFGWQLKEVQPFKYQVIKR